jgi:TonB family protein
MSLGFHTALVAAAVGLTRHPPIEEHAIPADPIPFITPPPASRPLTSSVAQAAQPVIAPTWQPGFAPPDLDPIALPTSAPTVSDILENGTLTPASMNRQAFGAPMSGEPLTAGTVDDPVEVVEQPAPRYPAVLAEARIAGKVELAYIVDTLGRVEPGSLRILESTHPAFAAAAETTVLTSRYRPARFQGRVVRQLVRQAFSFRVGM